MSHASSPCVLAGDIGGTKVNLATFRIQGHQLVLLRNERYPSASHDGLPAIIRKFLAGDDSHILAASFGIPGPVHGTRARATNLDWEIDATDISREFHIPNVSLLNDLAANAHGLSHLGPSDFAVLQQGAPDASGNRCVVSPGTGLGEAGLYWDGHRYHVWACEGGHTDFAPRNDLEIALLEHLMKQFKHVSVERVASGMGIENIYKFLRDTGRGNELPEVKAAMLTADPNRVISQFADSGKCPMSRRTLEIFAACLGAEAGNMALKTMSLGGVFIGGGLPAKVLTYLSSPNFLDAFNDKGRMSALMQKIPVVVILNDQTALLGAGYHALETTHSSAKVLF